MLLLVACGMVTRSRDSDNWTIRGPDWVCGPISSPAKSMTAMT
jgi:hypothetical protein